MVELEIDGTKVEVNEGSMLMDAAHKLGITIPHFCYHKKLSIAANCRMCLVDVEKAPKALPACATPVTNGMVVHTSSPKAKDAQNSVMEFLLINHPLDCPICDQGGECQLQDIAVGYGTGQSRYQEEKRVVFHKNVGPLISMEEMSRCIHCTRCVRFGQEIAGVMELGMLGRGEHSEITTFVSQTVDSELSGNMIDLCPVGALTSKPFRYQARTWELARHRAVSPHDSLGSNLIVQSKGNQVLRVVPFENEAINECWLSDRDRFAYEGLNSSERLTEPQIKRNGVWHPVPWDEALEAVKAGLTKAREAHGASTLGAYLHPYTTLEEGAQLGHLWQTLGSDAIEYRLQQSDLRHSSLPLLGCSIAEFSQLDTVWVVGSILRHEQPLLTARLRQMGKRGARIDTLSDLADDSLVRVQHWQLAAAQWESTLREVHCALATLLSVAPLCPAVNVSEPAIALARRLHMGEKIALVLGARGQTHANASVLYDLLRATAQLLTQAGKTACAGQFAIGANAVGLGLALPQKRQHAFENSKALLLWHAEREDFADRASFDQQVQAAEFIVACSPYQHAAAYAHVMLPIAPFSETAGTFINLEGRAQSFQGVVQPLAATRPGWKVIRVLANLLNLAGFDANVSTDIRDAVIRTPDTVAADAQRFNLAQPLKLEALTPSATTIDLPPQAPYQLDPIVRRAESLQKTRTAQAAR